MCVIGKNSVVMTEKAVAPMELQHVVWQPERKGFQDAQLRRSLPL